DQDFGDTWAELSIGVNHAIDKDKMIYADITKSFGGDYEMEWKANAGIRLRF
ncbi:MAG: autotransporter outer membrane beta-barrel domain-containing protein, partial [Dialister sp.]